MTASHTSTSDGDLDSPADALLRAKLAAQSRAPDQDRAALKTLVALAKHAVGSVSNNGDDQDDDEEGEQQPAAPALQVAVLAEAARRAALPAPTVGDTSAACRSLLALAAALLPTLADAELAAEMLHTAALPLLRAAPRGGPAARRAPGRDLLRALLPRWAAGAERVQIAAFLCVREMALADAEQHEACLKGLYGAFVGHARALDRAQTKFLINCFYEVLGEQDEARAAAAYRFAFVAIKKLAMELRSATRATTKDSVQQIYAPQFINALRLWADVLSRDAAKASALAPLRYPLIQIILGAIKAAFVPRYYPAHIVCLRMLLQLADANTYIPLAGFCLDMLAVKRGVLNSRLKPFDFARNFKAGKQYLGTRVYARGVVEQVYELLLEYFAALSASHAFPELVVPVAAEIRHKLKAFSDFPVKKQFAQLLAKLDENAEFVKQRRAALHDDKMLVDCPAFCSAEDGDSSGAVPPLKAYCAAVRRTKRRVAGTTAAASS